ncbi:AAA domain-containing protein [Nocardiopsis sp. NPDC050513]|uniref:AAA domain-containing protein n=1 Tax=Nocardiopsis sp. NPDC050513 TaxID=3364338 RepID=UPI00378C5818
MSPRRRRTRTAVLIGVGVHDGGDFPDLASPRADLDVIGAAIRRNCQFDQVRVLPDPTRAQALEAIEAPLVEGHPDDLVLVSFSGHGFMPDRTGRLHLALRDTRRGRPAATAISAEQLQGLLSDSPVTSKVLLLDCCHSGSFADTFATRSAGDDPGIDFEYQLQGRDSGTGTYVIAACGAGERAHEGDNSGGARPSPFSAAIAEGLGGAAADADGDGWCDGFDIYQYAHRKVADDGRQSVTGFVLGMRGTLRLARHAGSLTATPLASGGTPPGGSAGPAAVSGAVGDAGERATPAARAPAAPDFPRVLDYLRSCVGRDGVLRQLPALDSGEVAVCPVGSEPLLTGVAERWPLSGSDVVRVADRARQAGEVLRYGYPAVLFPARGRGRGRDTRVAPLFVMDVEDVTEAGRRHLVPVSEPQINQALLAAVTRLSHEDVAELTAWFQANRWGDGVSGLSDRARQVCDRLDLRLLAPLEAGALGARLSTGQPHRDGVQNVAIVYRANPADQANKQLLGDLDHRNTGIGVDRIGSTALGALDIPVEGAARAVPAGTGPVLPVVTGRSNTAQERIVDSAMRAPLTVVTGAPGTGKSTLITAVVTSAVAAGQSVLVASTNNDAVDVVVESVNALVDGTELMVRTGNADRRAREPEILSRMRDARIAVSPAESATARHHLADLRRRLDHAHRRLAAIGAAEHRLAVLAPVRHRLRGALPRELDMSGLGDAGAVRLWRQRLERALRPGWTAWPSRRWNRRLVRRGLRVEASPATADVLMRFFEVELDWADRLRASVEAEATGDAALAHHRALARARDERRGHSRTHLLGEVARSLAEGRRALDTRLESLHRGQNGWTGVPRLVRTVRAWATTSRSVRGALPPNPAMFDLVVVDEAGQCTAADLVPLLYRARRALVIGDPHQLEPVNTLEHEDDRRLQEIAGLDPDWLDARALVHSRTSAYHVAAAAVTRGGGDVHWLDEHYRCHPDIVTPVNRRFYGGRLSVRTPTPELVAPADPAVTWIDVKGATDRPGDRSCRNVKEAEQVVELLLRLRGELPGDATIGVVTPFRAQLTEIHGQLAPHAPKGVEVGTVHTFQGRECDVVVISPAASAGVRRSTGQWAQRQQNLWNVAVTRAKSRLYVVGDLDYWERQEGVLADLARPAGTDRGNPDVEAACQRLFGALADRGAAPRAGTREGGYACDLWVDTAAGPRAVVVDDAGTGDPVAVDAGRRLERVLDRVALFEAVSGVPTVRVPLWRCLAEPEAVAEELSGGARGKGGTAAAPQAVR